MVTYGTLSVSTIPCLPVPPPPAGAYVSSYPILPPVPCSPILSLLLPPPPPAPAPPQSPLCSPVALTPSPLALTPSPPSPIPASPLMGFLNCLVVVPSRKRQSYGMEAVWLEEFAKLFESLPHQWHLISAEQRPSGGNILYNYNDSAKVRFCCDICGHGWTSMKGRVAFFFDLTLLGLVTYTLYGQQCQKCESHDYQDPMWYPEEVTKVLTNLHSEVGKVFYGFYSKPREKNRRAGKPRTPHNATLCQACKDGVCSK